MKKPQIIYGSGINLSGIWHTKPIKMKYNETLQEWYDKGGNLCIRKLGLDIRSYGITTFADEDEKIVQLWISGALTAMKHIKTWIGDI